MSTFLPIHVVISLVGILSGFVVLFGLLAGKGLNGWTALFLVTTVFGPRTRPHSAASHD